MALSPYPLLFSIRSLSETISPSTQLPVPSHYPLPSPETCQPEHDSVNLAVSLVIAAGLLASYLPQHARIIRNKSGEGFSPWFLLLGSTSSASSFLNVIVLQWSAIRCCQYLTVGSCLESLMAVIQIGIQWSCFGLIMILFLIYFPPSQKYVRVLPVEPLGDQTSEVSTPVSRTFSDRIFTSLLPSSARSNGKKARVNKRRTSASSSSSSSSFDPRSVLLPSMASHSELAFSTEYRLSLTLAFVTLLHLLICSFVTFLLVLTLPRSSIPPSTSSVPETPLPAGKHPSVVAIHTWASFLGVMSTILAVFQYIPQIVHTWRTRLVGSLSIPMMFIQSPGSFIFVWSLIRRPGVDISTWGVYLMTGILQAFLLIMCIAWKFRQRSLGIDDWGRPKNGGLEGEDITAAGLPDTTPLLGDRDAGSGGAARSGSARKR